MNNPPRCLAKSNANHDQYHITMDHSPRGRLPPEIRNEIALLALTVSDTLLVQYPHPGGQKSPQLSIESYEATIYHKGEQDQKRIHRMRALTKTCSQLRSETKDLFFAVNSFAPFLHKPFARNQYPRTSEMTRFLMPLKALLH